MPTWVNKALDEAQPPALELSLYERAKDFLGVIKGTPPDLSTNPKYMEGYGEDRRP